MFSLQVHGHMSSSWTHENLTFHYLFGAFFFFLVFNHIYFSSDYQGGKIKNANMNYNGSKMKLKDLALKCHFSASNVRDESSDFSFSSIAVFLEG